MDGLLVDLRDNVSITMYFDFTYSGLHRCVVFFLLIVSLLHYLAIQLSRLQVCCNKISCQLLGCPKLTKRSQPLVGRRSPYCEDMWRRYWCLTSFLQRAQLHCKRCISYGNSVRTSVCLSHAGIVSKRRHAPRCSFHRWIGKCV